MTDVSATEPQEGETQEVQVTDQETVTPEGEEKVDGRRKPRGPMSDEDKDKIRKALAKESGGYYATHPGPMLGRKFTEEQKQKLSESLRASYAAKKAAAAEEAGESADGDGGAVAEGEQLEEASL